MSTAFHAAVPLSSHVFRFQNWFQWVLDAHAAGMSRADILFVLELCDALGPMRKALAFSEKEPQP